VNHQRARLRDRLTSAGLRTREGLPLPGIKIMREYWAIQFFEIAAIRPPNLNSHADSPSNPEIEELQRVGPHLGAPL